MRNKKLLSISIGVTLGVLVSAILFWRYYNTHWSYDARLARATGIDPTVYIEARDLDMKARHTHSLSSAEIAQIKLFLNYRASIIRYRAIDALTQLRHTPYAIEAQKLIQTKLSDPNPYVRIFALRHLNAMNPRLAAQEAEHLLSDPVEAVRSEASLILQNDKGQQQ
ncbi:MAG TPA: HEAT repeat domain-containing protein [Chthonomonas sp.]|uniref:HEAT repeat domain-containing protein n=1 Tax=Chthonomonas sp. TaxID=2282153 RepID=UPI002B4AEE8C|nr:HEAT repeat domain-containing protein [Chthonomonas sp.]HLI48006.1 HEAT repeat domain-containing protein [Chthonomonas sp.]